MKYARCRRLTLRRASEAKDVGSWVADSWPNHGFPVSWSERRRLAVSMWTAEMGPASQYVGGDPLYMRASAAWVGRYAGVESRARRSLASRACNAKVAESPRRQRISSTPQRARPIPGTGRGVEGGTLTRQRIVAGVGSPKSAANDRLVSATRQSLTED
jgi:hypothetical protein